MLIFKKEDKVRKLILAHLSRVQDCVSEARDAMETYMSGDKDKATEHRRELKKLEKEADAMKVEIRIVLHSGAFLPQIRADVHGLVDSVDRIADSADKLSSFLVNQAPDVPDTFQPEYLEIFGLCVSCFLELRKGLKDYLKPKGKIESLHDHVERVGELESAVDRKQAELERAIFASDLELARKLHLSQLLGLSVNVSDRAERVSDLLESAVMRSVV